MCRKLQHQEGKEGNYLYISACTCKDVLEGCRRNWEQGVPLGKETGVREERKVLHCLFFCTF